MKRLFHDQPIPEELRGAIIALGNFDGFHLGTRPSLAGPCSAGRTSGGR
jgi:riboflavin kinase/FMN adenylyltransferase